MHNSEALGYVIKACENAKMSEKDIQKVVNEMRYLFDMMSENEADEVYCRSKY